MKPIEAKITRTSKWISALLKIVGVITLIVVIASILGIGILIASGGDLQNTFISAFTVTSGSNELVITSVNTVILSLIYMTLVSLCMLAILYQTHLIFRDVSKEGTPFQHKHIQRIKMIAYFVGFLGILVSVVDSLIDSNMMNTYTLNIDFTSILVGFIIYTLALFFEYGCELQQLSDETL